jgi:hypothetical protein
MTHVALVSQLDAEFNEFLFAPICDDRNGMALSVLSALGGWTSTHGRRLPN